MDTQKKAVIIEDDKDLCLILKMIVGSQIPEVRCAYSLGEGKQLLDECDPEVVFLDNNLGDGQGISLIPSIKLRHPEATVIVMTAMPNLKKEAEEKGADLLLEKPMHPSAVIEALHTLRHAS